MEADIVKVTSLEEVRAKLLGASGGDPGLIASGKSFVMEFEGLTLTADDAARVIALMQEATGLPPRSEVILLGTIDGSRFRAKWERMRSDLLEVNVRGLVLKEHGAVLEYLRKLTEQRLYKVKLLYVVNGRPFELKLEENP